MWCTKFGGLRVVALAIVAVLIAQPWRPTARQRAGAFVMPARGVIATYAGGLRGSRGSAPTDYTVWPQSMAPAGTGRLLMADPYDDVVWLANFTGEPVTLFARTVATGRMVIVAGNESQGYSGDGDAATHAGIGDPQSLAVDGAHNLYILDRENRVIRKVNARTGIITTVAGTGVGGNCDEVGGPATRSGLCSPSAIAADHAGDLFITDFVSILEVNARSGILSTGPVTAALATAATAAPPHRPS